jgi:hypothetical protein
LTSVHFARCAADGVGAFPSPVDLTRKLAYAILGRGIVGPRVTLSTADEMGMNLGADELSFSSGYVAWNRLSTPSALTYMYSKSHSDSNDGSLCTSKCSCITLSGTSIAAPSLLKIAGCQQLSALHSREREGSTVPAFAMTTSRRPAVFIISWTAARLSASSAEVSLTTWSLPGCSFDSANSSSDASGRRAPAKTSTSGRVTRALTSAKPEGQIR